MSDTDYKLEFIHWFTEQRKPKYLILDDDTVEYWAKKISEHAQKGAMLGNCGKMCSDCAFKFEQPHDVSYLKSVDDAVLMLMQDGKFHCHSENHEDAGTPCIGFQYAQQYFKSIE